MKSSVILLIAFFLFACQPTIRKVAPTKLAGVEWREISLEYQGEVHVASILSFDGESITMSNTCSQSVVTENHRVETLWTRTVDVRSPVRYYERAVHGPIATRCDGPSAEESTFEFIEDGHIEWNIDGETIILISCEQTKGIYGSWETMTSTGDVLVVIKEDTISVVRTCQDKAQLTSVSAELKTFFDIETTQTNDVDGCVARLEEGAVEYDATFSDLYLTFDDSTRRYHRERPLSSGHGCTNAQFICGL